MEVDLHYSDREEPNKALQLTPSRAAPVSYDRSVFLFTSFLELGRPFGVAELGVRPFYEIHYLICRHCHHMPWTAQSESRNPLHPYYITSEHLKVELEDTCSKITGRFHFALPSNVSEFDQHGALYFDIPIWIPASPKRGDDSVKAFYSTFSSKFDDLTPSTRPIFNRTFDIEVALDKKPHNINGFSLRELKYTPKEWRRKGFAETTVFITFEPEQFASDPEMSIAYRQPLLLSKNKAVLLYIPNFMHLPPDKSTANLKKYSVLIENHSRFTFTSKGLSIPPGGKVILPLANEVPIYASGSL